MRQRPLTGDPHRAASPRGVEFAEEVTVFNGRGEVDDITWFAASAPRASAGAGSGGVGVFVFND